MSVFLFFFVCFKHMCGLSSRAFIPALFFVSRFMHTGYLDRGVIESILSISTPIYEMPFWWINNGSSFQVHLWTGLNKFLTQWNLETAIVPLTINLLLKPCAQLFSPAKPPPTLSLRHNAPHWVFFHQGEVSARHRHKGLSYTGPNTQRGMHECRRLHTFCCTAPASLKGQYLSTWRQLHHP